MTEACTRVTSTITTVTCTRRSEYNSTSPNHVCTTLYPHQHGAQSTHTLSLYPSSQLAATLKERVCVCVCVSGRKEQRFWDGQKAVYVVLLGSTVVLPCINRRGVWTDGSNEEEDQQVCVVCVIVCGFVWTIINPRLDSLFITGC